MQLLIIIVFEIVFLSSFSRRNIGGSSSGYYDRIVFDIRTSTKTSPYLHIVSSHCFALEIICAIFLCISAGTHPIFAQFISWHQCAGVKYVK